MSARGWARAAACKEADPELFHSKNDDDRAEARAICGRCPVRADCLDDAIEAEASANTKDRHGIAGGMEPAERRAEYERRVAAGAAPPSRVVVAPCGTDAAYRRHLRKGEPVDALCQGTHARRWAERKAKAR